MGCSYAPNTEIHFLFFFFKNSAHFSDEINRATCGWDMSGWGGKVWGRVREQGAGSDPEQSLLQQFLQPLHTHTALHHSCFCTGRVFWEAGEEKHLQGFLKSILAPHHSSGLFLSQVKSPAQLDFVAAREGDLESAPEVSAPGRSILRSKAEWGWSKIPTF